MVIGVLKEIKPNEYRVAAVPATVQEIVRRGHEVLVESGAGVGSGYSDADYEAAGAKIATTDEVWTKAELYYKVKDILKINLEERHIRGGLATKRKYTKLKNE